MTYDKQMWDRFKGILILLVVLSHITALMFGNFFGILYSFHVSSFIFLPFIFNHDLISKENIKKVFRRYYTPFIFFVFIFIFLKYIIFNDIPSIRDIFEVIFFGSRDFLRETTGSMILWFFPTLISTLLFLMVFNSINKTPKYIFFFTMLILHYKIIEVSSSHLMYLPMGMAVAIYLFPLGIIIAYIFQKYIEPIQNNFILIFIVFLILLALFYGKDYNLGSIVLPENIFDTLFLDTIMITGFFVILSVANKIKSNLLSLLGRKSIMIYTIHPFIIYGLSLVILPESLMINFVKYLFILLASLTLAKLLDRLNFTKYIYPR